MFGAIIGKQKGRNIEVMNSFELDVTEIDGQMIVDRDYYNLKEEQFKQVFSDMDFLGWYSSGDYPTKVDADVHKQVQSAFILRTRFCWFSGYVFDIYDSFHKSQNVLKSYYRYWTSTRARCFFN